MADYDSPYRLTPDFGNTGLATGINVDGALSDEGESKAAKKKTVEFHGKSGGFHFGASLCHALLF
jgi:hypothetical protein